MTRPKKVRGKIPPLPAHAPRTVPTANISRRRRAPRLPIGQTEGPDDAGHPDDEPADQSAQREPDSPVTQSCVVVRRQNPANMGTRTTRMAQRIARTMGGRRNNISLRSLQGGSARESFPAPHPAVHGLHALPAGPRLFAVPGRPRAKARRPGSSPGRHFHSATEQG